MPHELSLADVVRVPRSRRRLQAGPTHNWGDRRWIPGTPSEAPAAVKHGPGGIPIYYYLLLLPLLLHYLHYYYANGGGWRDGGGGGKGGGGEGRGRRRRPRLREYHYPYEHFNYYYDDYDYDRIVRLICQHLNPWQEHVAEEGHERVDRPAAWFRAPAAAVAQMLELVEEVDGRVKEAQPPRRGALVEREVRIWCGNIQHTRAGRFRTRAHLSVEL